MELLVKAVKHPIKAVGRLVSTAFNLCTFRLKGVVYKGIPQFNGLILVSKARNSRITIGKHCAFNSGRKCNPVGFENKMMLTASRSGSISIGNRVGMSNTVIFAMNHVEIGDNVMLGNGVRIFDTDFHSLNVEERLKYNADDGIVTRPVKIKSGAFVGAGVLILKGVTIGENSVIGAASVVTKSVPDGEIWAGNPARFIRKI